MKENIYRKNSIKTMVLMLPLVLMLTFAAVSSVFAAPGPSDEETQNTDTSGGVINGAFEVTGYDLSAVISKDHSYEITEYISVNIPEQLQSIEFAIPSGNFRVSDLEVENTAYSSKKARDASTVSIVDPDSLSAGSHKYKIKYTIREFEDRDSTKDMFYFNALLPEWKQPIGRIDINLSFPDDFPWDDIQCYAGQFGVQDITNRVELKTNESERTVSVSGEKIPENFAVTIKAELPDGYWKGALNGSWTVNAVLGVMGGILVVLAALWLIGGRDPKVRRVEVTKPLEGVPPSELGYIFDGEVGIRDILMLIIYFGTKGYLRISEYEPKRYRLIRKEAPEREEKLYRNAYNILFEDTYKNRAVEMKDLGDRLARVRDAIKDDIAAGYTDAEAVSFKPISMIFRVLGIVITAVGIGISNALSYRYEYLNINYAESVIAAGIFAAAVYSLAVAIDRRDSASLEGNRFLEVFAGAVSLTAVIYVAFGIFRRMDHPAVAIAFAVMAVIAVFFISIMRARGRTNAELVMKIRRLRNFIYHPTPRELLENHLADENYYYDMLQYALALGAEESWAISFLTLDVPEPDWYSDDIEGHAYSNIREEMTTLDYARDIKAFMRTIETAFHEMERRKHRR